VLLLAFDTATPRISVALHDGTRVLAEMSAEDARRHGELLTPFIARILSDAAQPADAITGIVTGVGPGPYTGLRVGVVTARVLAEALQVPAHGVCTLDVIAHEAAVVRRSIPPGIPFVVATDARRKEVYWARYGPEGERLSGPAVSRPADVPAQHAVEPAVGQGAWLYPESFGKVAEPEFPSASVLAALAAERLEAGMALLPAEPLYLRRPDARQPGPPKAVTPR
jgi:tRNA threonylcarbamoyl adenosine modification protein YeaZ